MYTDSMRRAFHAVQAPKGFAVTILDNEAFLTVKLDERQFVRMDHDQKIQALQYVVNLKKALEMEGAIVLVTREALK
jgi:CYTH domain-containing protein